MSHPYPWYGVVQIIETVPSLETFGLLKQKRFCETTLFSHGQKWVAVKYAKKIKAKHPRATIKIKKIDLIDPEDMEPKACPLCGRIDLDAEICGFERPDKTVPNDSKMCRKCGRAQI